MRFPWANITLFIILFIQLITGYLGMINARETFRWVLWWHGIGAYALVLIFYWKSSIILDAWRRKKTWTWQRIGFIILTLLLIGTLVMGFMWTFYGPIYWLGFSLMSLHIYVGVLVMALMVWHSWRMRFILRLPQTLGRRQFNHWAVTTLLGTAVWLTAGQIKRSLHLPGAARRFSGSYEKGSFSGRFPVVSWIFDNPPPIDPDTWQLVIDGAVKRPLTLTYAQLRQQATTERTETLDCTGGWYATQVWTGMEVSQLLEMVGIEETAASVTFRAISGYQRRFTLAEAASFLLAVDVASAPLSHGHGFPLRLVATNKRGVEWVKWITHIHINTTSKIWQAPLPLQ